MRTLLIITRYFPPHFDVGGKRPYRFARHLHKHGWRTVVWTSQLPTNRPVDPTPIDLPPEVKILREYQPPWLKEQTGRPSDGTSTVPVADWTWRKAKSAPLVDKELWWTPRSALRLRDVVEQERVDAILATSSPYSALVAGGLVKKLTGKPLCLDLRDPWTLNFLNSRRPDWVNRIDEAVEKHLFQYADRVVFSCESAATAYRRLYPDLPGNRIHWITNSFEPMQQPPARPPDGPTLIVHFGNCYGLRRLEPLLEAVARLKAQVNLKPEQLQIVNLGRIAAADLRIANTLSISRFLQHRPMVPYEEGMALLASADLQLLLPYGSETLFVPAKFYDYLKTATPILCLARPSELTEYVERTGSGRWFEPEDVWGIASTIRGALERRRGGEAICTPRPAEIKRFSATETTTRLARLLEEMVDGR